MRSAILLTLLITGLASTSFSQVVCADDSVQCRVTPTTTYKSVFEHLTGAANGTNHNFELSRTPSPEFPVHLFRNGLEQTPGTEYTIQGRAVTLTGKAVEVSGEDFEAAYMVAGSEREATTNIPSRSVRANQVLSKYLERSLKIELDHTPAGIDLSSAPTRTQDNAEIIRASKRSIEPISPYSVSAGIADRSMTAKIQRRVDDPESLRMLASAIRRSEAVTRSRGTLAKGKRAQTAREAEGLEGTGDQAISSPFEFLANSQNYPDPTSVGTNVQSSPVRSARSKSLGTERVPASFRMLQRRMSE